MVDCDNGGIRFGMKRSSSLSRALTPASFLSSNSRDDSFTIGLSEMGGALSTVVITEEVCPLSPSNLCGCKAHDAGVYYRCCRAQAGVLLLCNYKPATSVSETSRFVDEKLGISCLSVCSVKKCTFSNWKMTQFLAMAILLS